MKFRFCAALLLAALAIPIFAGCAIFAQPLDAAEKTMTPHLEVAEEVIEPFVDVIISEESVPMAPAPAVQTETARPTTLLTKEEAEKIALEHAGFTADQVQRLRTKLDYDRGKPEYEVEFHVDRVEYDYEIDAETGKVRSADKDRDD